MKPSEIILQDKSIPKGSAKKLLLAMQNLVKAKTAIMLQKNNTILVLIKLENEDAELRMFTADTPAKLGESLQYFFKKLKNSKLKKIYGTDPINSPLISMLGKDFGMEVQDSDRPDYQWMIER